MWRQNHPDADLEDVPGNLVTASGSGLDPHITLQNAKFQVDRASSKWAANLKRDLLAVRKEIEEILQKSASAPFGGLVGQKFVNVLKSISNFASSTGRRRHSRTPSEKN